ncbi:putative UDP-rhamnose:rhamnosyltransferase 1 [Nicotiana tabacum]|uniref:UDP-rhamnose:rhamnosyltransferase 1 n=1 Tax=Nicotiana tabacum TaxID=4097 RepID=A0A1S4BBB5_TOBAC|nr:putative UDP-rhamnose:rhamnosyltransferase 1 [Nicotiana tomentosiformis]XP_016486220.1 PREDICTED: putative UDP-rhamnose:rhamnosyltransferase 1 [Nicotiana tabacum]
MKKDSIHVVMVPWLAFGHLQPFFQLSVALAKEKVHVSFLSTPRNIKRLPKLPPNLAPLVNLVEFPLPSVDGSPLPADAEASVDISADQMEYLYQAFDLLQEPVKNFIADKKTHWVIADFVPDWVADIARELNIPLLKFSVFTASSRVFFGPPKPRTQPGQVKNGSKPLHELLVSPPPWVDFPSMVAFRKYEALDLISILRAENESRETLLGHAAVVEGSCRAVAIRTCMEFEGDYLDTYNKVAGKPVIPIGLLPPKELPANERTLACHPNWQKISKWLDEQKPRSVVFVGFGSECKLTKNQVYEIANGVQLSGLPFLWILQKPSWALNDVDALPSGFGAATEGRGLVHIGWAPQKEILAHPSIGGSLFHGGWGSAIETLQHGHVLVVLPFVFDQGLNARLLVEKGVAIEVRRNEEDGSFSGNDIATSLREAIVSEEGEELRARARKAAAIFGDQKLHDSYVKNFVEYMRSNGEMKV